MLTYGVIALQLSVYLLCCIVMLIIIWAIDDARGANFRNTHAIVELIFIRPAYI